MEIVYKGIGEIRPYENNPRKNDGAVDAVAASIKEFGWKVPVVIDKDGVIEAVITPVSKRVAYTIKDQMRADRDW